MSPPKPPLSHIRVVELGELLAGPFIGTLLGEFGADVIKIERPGQGDILRQFGPIVDGESLFWVANGRNKRSVVINLQEAAGQTILRDLLSRTDVLINSLRPGTLDRWGLADIELRAAYPALVIVYASAFGRGGPYSSAGGYDPIAQGYSSLSDMTGEADGPPMRAGGAIPVCDFMTGILGALGAVLSLYARENTESHEGQVVDVGLYDAAFRMIGPLLTNFELTGVAWKRDGNHSLGGAPTGHFQTSDGSWICTSVQNDQQFTRLAQLVGRQEWIDDQRFSSLKLRTKNRNEIEEHVASWIYERSRHEVIGAFEKAKLTIGPINSVADLSLDPHLQQRGSAWHHHPQLGRVRVPDVVPRLERTPGEIRNPAPKLGAHTKEVLCGLLNYSDSRFQELISGGVVS
jgi:formyl-CoA transferase